MASISAVGFGNFSIREYVAAIRETDPESCCPFKSIPDHNVPQDVKDREVSELEGLKQHETGPADAPEIITIADSDDDTSRTISDLPVEFVKSQCSNDRTVNEGASNANSIPAATDAGSSRRKLKKIKKPRYRLIVDIYKELDERKVKSDVLCAPKGNSDELAGPRDQLAVKLRNDSDDVTVRRLRKRKAAQRNRNKKQKGLNSHRAKEPKLDETETSSHGPKGLNSHGHFATGKLQEAKCRGSGACDGLGGSEPSGSGSVVGRLVAAAGELKGSTGTEMDVARVVDREILVCSLNQNPAEFLMSFESGYFRSL